MIRKKGDAKLNKYFLWTALTLVMAGFLYFLITSDHNALAEEEKDTAPPKLYSVEVKDLQATSTTIIWQTDENSDSLVNYGLDTDYGMAREPFFDKKEHKLTLSNLLPNKVYYFRVTSADSNGNQAISSDYTFTTPKIEDEGGFGGTEDGAGLNGQDSGKGWGGTEDGNKGWEKEGENQLTEIIEKIEQIQQEEILEEIIEKVQEQATEKLKPPIITIDLAKVEVGTDYAIISWKTDKEANTIVSLVADSGFNASAENPYTWNEGYPDEMVLDHTVRINGLQPATIYHYQVQSKSAVGLIGKSSDGVFRTESLDPEIINLRMGKIEEHSATLLWTTNVPCNEMVEYTNLVTNKKKLEGNSSFFTYHSVQLSELDFDTPYMAIVKVENEYSKKKESNPIYFTTIKDEIAPVISKIGTESTLYPGSDNKVQTIINWLTDEASICELSYQKGLGTEKRKP